MGAMNAPVAVVETVEPQVGDIIAVLSGPKAGVAGRIVGFRGKAGSERAVVFNNYTADFVDVPVKYLTAQVAS